MTSISSLLSSYSNLFSGSSSTGTTATSTPSLADALDAASNSSSNSQDAYSLNFSSEAQQYLNGSSSTSSSSSDTSSTFQLTSTQQQTITNILNKYKDASYTQATLTSIENDLKSAGLSPSQMSLKDKISSFSPTSVLVDALNGNTTSPEQAQATSDATEQTKSTNYLNSIISQWQSVSSTYSATTKTGTNSTTSTR